MGNGVEFRIMPSDDEGHWYWEVIKNGHEVVARGVAEVVQQLLSPASDVVGHLRFDRIRSDAATQIVRRFRDR